LATVALSAGCSQATPRGAGTSKIATAPVQGVREIVRTVWPVDASVVWAWTAVDALGGTEHILRTRDAGGSWSDVTPAGLTNQSGARRINSLFVLDGGHAWTTYGGITGDTAQTVDSTADAGRHWSRLSRLPSPGCALDFVSPDHGWCVLDRAAMGQDRIALFATNDGGSTWQRINPPNAPPAGCDKDVGFTDGMLGWAVTACVAGTPPIYRTRDGGAHWTRTAVQPRGGDPGSGAQFAGIPVVASGRAAVALDLDRRSTLIYHSSDGGDSWQPMRPPGPASIWAVDIRTPQNWILIHADQLFATDDAGRTWTRTTTDHHFGEITSSYHDFAPLIDFPTHSTGWVRQVEPARLWHTSTAGRTWTEVTIPRT
jgi:photosystem II stability/assembly factor-like uncharacterized protein